jgi:hypothetical protein
MKEKLVSVGRFFASVKMTIYLIGLLALYIFVLAVWSSGELQDVGPITYLTTGIAEGIAGRLFYSFLLLNLFLLILKRVLVFVRQYSQSSIQVSPEQVLSLPDHIVMDAEEITNEYFNQLNTRLSEMGYHVKHSTQGGIYAVKGRLSELGKLVLAFSLFLLLLGLFISLNFRTAYEIVAGEGQDVFLKEQARASRNSWTEGSRETKAREADNLPDVSFRLNRVDTAGESDTSRPWYSFLSGNITAWIAYPADTLESEAAIGFYPPQRVMGEYLQLTDFGYAPMVLIKDQQGRIMTQSFVILRLLPAGTEDSIQPPGSPYSFYFSLAGQEHAGDSRIPDYILKITRGVDIVYQGQVAQGKTITFEGNTLSLPETTHWVSFNVVDDYGIPISFTAIILGVIGLGLTFCCKFIWYRRELYFIPVMHEPAVKKVYVGSKAERSRKTHSEQLDLLLEKLL